MYLPTRVPLYYRVLSLDSGTKHIVAMVAVRLWRHHRTVSCVWWEQCNARFLSDTIHCPMVTSKSVRPTTVPDNGLGSKVVTMKIKRGGGGDERGERRRGETGNNCFNPFCLLLLQAALHAELNGVAAFFLTGVRRFLYRGFAGYFRHVFHWTRQALASAEQPPDSSVDDQRWWASNEQYHPWATGVKTLTVTKETFPRMYCLTWLGGWLKSFTLSASWRS